MPNPLIYLALALSAVLVVFPLPSAAQPPQNPDVEALLRWKKSLPNQTIVSSWILDQTNGNSSASSPCNWRGISCNSAGNVTGLNLAYTGLQGTLDHLNFSYFCLLLHLDLKFNRLNGIIPANIGLLSNLVYLDLSNNFFSGTIPLSIANLTKVVELDFSRNPIIGQLDPRLFPERGSSQAKIGLLSIQRLLFTDNSLDGPLPSEIGNLENLTLLALDHNNFSGPIPQSLGNLSKITQLYLGRNHLNGSIPYQIGNLVKLQIMLDLSHNKIHGEIPSSICNLSSLEYLVLSNNNLTGVIPQCLGNFSNILVLDLRMNGFHGAIPTTFGNGNELRSLNLYGNHLQGPVPRSLANCKTMEVLDIGKNNLSGAFPHWLESLPELQVLVLKSNRFHGPIGTSGTKTPFPKLRIFDLSHNKFTGLLPKRYFLNFKAMMNVDTSTMLLQYMGDYVYQNSVELVLKGVEIELEYILTIFTTIDFSCNNFRGEIPNDIGKLQGLRLLNLSQNSLSGHLPSLLGNIKLLESLDLSSNLLTGQIPGELKSLTFLAVLNLSKNHLAGPIPQGNQFNLFSNDSYVGNSGLCGLPLSKKCGDREAQEQPISQDGDDDDDFMAGFTWRIVLIGYGCGFLIGATMGFAMFLIGRPRWFTRILGEEPRRKVVRISQIGWRRSNQS